MVTSVASQRQGSQCKLYRRPEIPRCSSGMVVDLPVGVPTTGSGSDSTENCGVPQVQYSDQVVDVLAVAVHRRLDVPVIMQRRSLAVGGASDSAHRRSQRTSHLQQRRIRFQRG